MKNLSINFLVNVLLLLVGVLLVVFHSEENLILWVAMMLGVMFVLPSGAYLIAVALQRDSERNRMVNLGVLPAVGGVCFGVILLAHAAMFNKVITVLMGVMLIVLGLFHLVYLILSRKVISTRLMPTILALAIIAAGIVILAFDAVRIKHPTVTLITGISLIAFALATWFEHLAERSTRKKAEPEPTDTITNAGADTDNNGTIDRQERSAQESKNENEEKEIHIEI